MDSSLIHLLPNLLFAFRHHPRHAITTTSPPPSHPPPPPQQQQQQPPYTLHPPTSPLLFRTSSSHTTNPTLKTTPLIISLLGPAHASNPKDKARPLLYCLQDTLQLGPGTAYQGFIDDLRVRLERLGIEAGKGGWKVGIMTVGRRRSRMFCWSERRGLEVRRETWEDVRMRLGRGKLGGLRVDCWRD